MVYQDSIHLYVVGVVRDVYMRGLWREMEPMMIRYILPNQYTQLVASARTEDVSALHVAMGEQWKELFPNRLYNGRMLSEDQSEMIKVNNNIVIMFTLIGIIAMMLSVTGLFTLVSLNIIKRMKEIGVRKVLGASIGSITRIINTEFVIILSLAALMGCAFSYYLINALMSTIWKYYQSLTLPTFIFAIAILFIASFLTIGFKVFAAASINPATILKDE